MKKLISCIAAFAFLLGIFGFTACGPGGGEQPPQAVMHTVTFDTDGGTAVAPVQVEHGKTFTEPEQPQKDGSAFVCWNLGSEGYDFSAPVLGDLVLTAVWQDVSGAIASGEPVYEDGGGRMFISLWNEPRPVNATLQEALSVVRDAGFDTYFKWSYGQYDAELCAENGLNFMTHVWSTRPQDYNPLLAPERVSDGLTGFIYKDEPAYDEIDALGSLARNHVQYYEDRLFFVNLYPTYAESGIFGPHTYEEYVAHFCETVFGVIGQDRMISVDFYPLYADGRIREDWLACYEVIAKYARQYGARFHFYVANTQHGPYRALDADNLHYMVNVAMTYGGNALGYFTYQNYEDDWGHGLVEEDGVTPTDTYAYAQQVNTELLAWDHVFLDFSWESTMVLEGEGGGTNACFSGLQYAAESIDVLQSASASEDTLIGRFTGKDGEAALMVTNFSDPEDGRTDTVSLSFAGAERAVVYIDGVRQVCDAENGALTLSPAPGRAAFVIPFR